MNKKTNKYIYYLGSFMASTGVLLGIFRVIERDSTLQYILFFGGLSLVLLTIRKYD